MDSKFKILGIIVTYYPELNEVIRNIYRFIDNIDLLIIWENTPRDDNEEYKLNISDSKKIVYMGTGKNEGISYALNRGYEYAKENGFSHLLTMDQDSVWDDFEAYKNAINPKEIAIFGPMINDNTIYEEKKIEWDHVITSGALIHISVLDKVGGYFEGFKVDGIDVEFCYCARKKGIKTYKITSGRLEQKFGDYEEKKLLGQKWGIYNYSPFRVYGILMSHILLLRSYKIACLLKKRIIYTYIIKFLINIILFENSKANKLKYGFKGIIKGLSLPSIRR